MIKAFTEIADDKNDLNGSLDVVPLNSFMHFHRNWVHLMTTYDDDKVRVKHTLTFGYNNRSSHMLGCEFDFKLFYQSEPCAEAVLSIPEDAIEYIPFDRVRNLITLPRDTIIPDPNSEIDIDFITQHFGNMTLFVNLVLDAVYRRYQVYHIKHVDRIAYYYLMRAAYKYYRSLIVKYNIKATTPIYSWSTLYPTTHSCKMTRIDYGRAYRTVIPLIKLGFVTDFHMCFDVLSTVKKYFEVKDMNIVYRIEYKETEENKAIIAKIEDFLNYRSEVDIREDLIKFKENIAKIDKALIEKKEAKKQRLIEEFDAPAYRERRLKELYSPHLTEEQIQKKVELEIEKAIGRTGDISIDTDNEWKAERNTIIDRNLGSLVDKALDSDNLDTLYKLIDASALF
jgi:hypothetical protein